MIAPILTHKETKLYHIPSLKRERDTHTEERERERERVPVHIVPPEFRKYSSLKRVTGYLHHYQINPAITDVI